MIKNYKEIVVNKTQVINASIRLFAKAVLPHLKIPDCKETFNITKRDKRKKWTNNLQKNNKRNVGNLNQVVLFYSEQFIEISKKIGVEF